MRASVAVVWCLKYLPSNRASRVRLPAMSEILISLQGLGVCVSFVCILSCVVSGDGPDIVLATHLERSALVYQSSVQVNGLLLLLEASDPRAFGL